MFVHNVVYLYLMAGTRHVANCYGCDVLWTDLQSPEMYHWW